MDILPEYPLEFYRMAEKGVSPKMVSAYMTTVSSMINKSDPYSGMMFTHDTSDISLAPTGSIYGTLEDADQLLDAQIRLTKKIRAVDENKVFTILIQHHLLRDMQGCLRTFHPSHSSVQNANRPPEGSPSPAGARSVTPL